MTALNPPVVFASKSASFLVTAQAERDLPAVNLVQSSESPRSRHDRAASEHFDLHRFSTLLSSATAPTLAQCAVIPLLGLQTTNNYSHTPSYPVSARFAKSGLHRQAFVLAKAALRSGEQEATNEQGRRSAAPDHVYANDSDHHRASESSILPSHRTVLALHE